MLRCVTKYACSTVNELDQTNKTLWKKKCCYIIILKWTGQTTDLKILSRLGPIKFPITRRLIELIIIIAVMTKSKIKQNFLFYFFNILIFKPDQIKPDQI